MAPMFGSFVSENPKNKLNCEHDTLCAYIITLKLSSLFKWLESRRRLLLSYVEIQNPLVLHMLKKVKVNPNVNIPVTVLVHSSDSEDENQFYTIPCSFWNKLFGSFYIQHFWFYFLIQYIYRHRRNRHKLSEGRKAQRLLIF